MTRVLVTGASGLLGRRVVSLLAEAGSEVLAASRSGREGTVSVDLMEPEPATALIEGFSPQAVLHLAGGHARGTGGVYAANVLPSIHVQQALVRAAPEALLVVVGSAAEYGDGTGAPLSERSTCLPVSDYGRAKLAQTQLARALALRANSRVLVVRPFNVVAHDLPVSGALGNIRRQLLAADGPVRPVVCGRTDVVRDFVTADDVARVMAGLLLDPPDLEVVNLCSGLGVTVQQVMDGAAEALGVRARVLSDSELVAIPAADTVVGDPSLLASTGHRLDGSVPVLVRALLGSDPRV